MWAVFFAATAIAAATWAGSLTGNVLRQSSERIQADMNCVAAGIMLYAAINGLVFPAVNLSRGIVLPICFGIFLGAYFLNRIHRLTPLLLSALSVERSDGQIKSLLFVFAMAIHHFPEGLAAGVSFGSGDAAGTAAVCVGIAVQNFPEAMLMMPAMEQAGWGKAGGYIAAAAGGGLEIVGLLLGVAAVQASGTALPLLLAFAAGTMLYIIMDTMIPDNHSVRNDGESAYSILVGFCGMLLLSAVMERFL